MLLSVVFVVTTRPPLRGNRVVLPSPPAGFEWAPVAVAFGVETSEEGRAQVEGLRQEGAARILRRQDRQVALLQRQRQPAEEERTDLLPQEEERKTDLLLQKEEADLLREESMAAVDRPNPAAETRPQAQPNPIPNPNPNPNPGLELDALRPAFAQPSWAELAQAPVRVPTEEAWRSLAFAKKVAVLCPLPALHLTVLSCAAPCLAAAFIGAASSPAAPCLWVGTLALWHLSYNMFNDAQDFKTGLCVPPASAFRMRHGSPLAQGYISKQTFTLTLAALSAAALAGSAALATISPACVWVFPLGLAATLFSSRRATPAPRELLLVCLVWGPAMFGGGWAAATGCNSGLATWVLSLPLALGAAAVTFGKHIDAIEESGRTLPSLLGREVACKVCAAALVSYHAALLALVM